MNIASWGAFHVISPPKEAPLLSQKFTLKALLSRHAPLSLPRCDYRWKKRGKLKKLLEFRGKMYYAGKRRATRLRQKRISPSRATERQARSKSRTRIAFGIVNQRRHHSESNGSTTCEWAERGGSEGGEAVLAPGVAAAAKNAKPGHGSVGASVRPWPHSQPLGRGRSGEMGQKER